MIWLWVILGLGALVLSLSWICYRMAFYVSAKDRKKENAVPLGSQFIRHSDRMKELQEAFLRLPFEPVQIVSDDGVNLFGRYYHVRDGAPIQLQMHGYRGGAIRDFCGGNLLSRQMGHNALVIDQRAHGSSGGRTICFGIRERLDCLAWSRYLAERFPDAPIFLVGVSMGASTVLMASELALPESVVGIIADCPYNAPRDIIAKTCRDMGLPARLVWPFIDLGMRLYGGCRLSQITAAEAVKHAKAPILLLHGEEDRLVPCQMSRQIAQCCGTDCRLELFPDAGHGLSCLEDPDRYKAVVSCFCQIYSRI